MSGDRTCVLCGAPTSDVAAVGFGAAVAFPICEAEPCRDTVADLQDATDKLAQRWDRASFVMFPVRRIREQVEAMNEVLGDDAFFRLPAAATRAP